VGKMGARQVNPCAKKKRTHRDNRKTTVNETRKGKKANGEYRYKSRYRGKNKGTQVKKKNASRRGAVTRGGEKVSQTKRAKETPPKTRSPARPNLTQLPRSQKNGGEATT